MLVINSIEKSRLQADSFSYSGNGVAWKARFVLFLGFALLAGGLAGSVVCLSNGAGFLEPVSVLDLLPGRLLMMLLDGHGPQVPHQELSAADAVLRNRECHCQWPGYVEVSWV